MKQTFIFNGREITGDEIEGHLQLSEAIDNRRFPIFKTIPMPISLLKIEDFKIGQKLKAIRSRSNDLYEKDTLIAGNNYEIVKITADLDIDVLSIVNEFGEIEDFPLKSIKRYFEILIKNRIK